MGKADGFLKYQRKEAPSLPPAERTQGFQEFHLSLKEAERREQGARCMNCGVPFCQSAFGCPLKNLIPEWNDEVFSGNMRHGLSRLLKTNNFPEFTGRVCPALCETACVCGLNDSPVTIRENELSLIEAAWENGWMAPSVPSVRSGKKIAVIGSGPAGLAAADQLNSRGHSVTVYEQADRPGGLLMYGIPNMKLDKSVVLRRIEKMKAEGVSFICGTKAGRDISAQSLREAYDAVILCCGAGVPRQLEAEKEKPDGVYQALEYLTASTKAVLKRESPAVSAGGKTILVVGNGDTASDCVATAIRQGARSVKQLVRKPAPVEKQIAWPHPGRLQRPDYAQEEAQAVFGEDPRMYQTEIKKFISDADGRLTSVVISTCGKESELPADMVIVAAGFSGADPETAAAFGLSLNERNRLGNAAYETGENGIFVCGDMRRGPSLVVWAIAEGRECAKKADRYLEGYTNL